VILLLPCSATKPYSYSRSHQLYQSALATLPRDKQGYVQELILTSPLGVIPRELERVYPSAHYDIPVSGDWSFEEKQITIKLLGAILSPKVAENSIKIIAHVSDEYIELCKTVEHQLKKPFIYTTQDQRPTSSKAIANLSKQLTTALADEPPLHYNRQAELVHTIADYQFGLSVGKELYSENISIKGRPPAPFKVFDQKELVGVIHPASGQLTLSLQTGKSLAKLEKYFVRFDGDQLRGSTLFAVGISNADEMIRPTDQVVILNKEDTVVGVGEAIVSGKDMRKMTGGPAVKIKQKI
jgi:archaeosine synthase